jgi:ribose transport system ATP-binding protein
MALIEVRGLHKSFFGVEVLHGVGLSLEAGEILGLVGENGSGKSTTMNVLGGVHPRDAGEILLAGEPYQPRGPRDAQAAGIAFIHQELNLFENLSIEENLFLGRFPTRGPLPLLDRGRMRERARKALAAVDLPHLPSTPLARLSQGERQLVEIAKALIQDAKAVIFDEPTTSLTRRETERLFGIIRRLKDRGIGVIYISHILADVLGLCDRVTVLRDGSVVGGGAAAELGIERLIRLMVGRELTQLFPPRASGPQHGSPLLEVEGVSQPGIVRDVSFKVSSGEIVGLAGLMGSGRSELARILFGLDPFAAGTVRLAGETVAEPDPAGMMARGVAFLTEDRRAEGLLMEASIHENIALPSLDDFATGWARLIQRPRLGHAVTRAADAVQINAKDYLGTLARSLSGGNQQKVVLAKWLLREPRLLILDEPTRGIDVGAKHEVYKIVAELAARGAAILMISSELEELMGMCDRILVMAHGQIQAEHERGGFDGERIMESAMWRAKLPGAAA